MKQYLDLVEHILTNGEKKDDRTGTGTLAVLGYQMRFDLKEGFPLLTTKRLHLKSIIHELLWFLKGDTNIKYLNDRGVTIWDEWADKNGNLGPIYGKQWRSWPKPVPHCNQCNTKVIEPIDQIQNSVDLLKRDPTSRRNIVCAWNVADLEDMAMTPCHCLFQFYANRGRLSCCLYQRSCDVGLGVPFNIASYALLTMMMAQVCNLEPGEFIWTGGDTHIYLNHVDQLKEQLQRAPKEIPQMRIHDRKQNINSFLYGDFEISNYDPHPAIKMDISV